MASHRAWFDIADPKQVTLRTWLARLLIGLVTGFSLQAAVSFVLYPDRFMYAYELSGAAGEAAVRGAGVLFLMWNVPYVFAVLDPVRYRLALYFSVLVQLTGLLGGIYIFTTLTDGLVIVSATMIRFIIFSGSGLALLIVAYILIKDTLPYQYNQALGLNGRVGSSR